MAENKNWIEQQAMNRINNFNRQRSGTAILICIFMAFLLLLPGMENVSFYIRVSVFCSPFVLSYGFLPFVSDHIIILCNNKHRSDSTGYKRITFWIVFSPYSD